MSRSAQVRRWLWRARGIAARGVPRPAWSLSELFDTQAELVECTREALSMTSSAGASAAQQRNALDAAADHVRQGGARGRDLRASAQRAREALQQIQLVALNAGLEGARLGETAGKPLLLVSEETKSHVARALAALEEHSGLVAQIDGDRERMGAQLADASTRSATLADELLRGQSALRRASSLVETLGKRLSAATGTDPEVAQAMNSARQHAEGLLEALTALTTRAQPGLVGSLALTLEPSFARLRRLLRELERDAETPS